VILFLLRIPCAYAQEGDRVWMFDSHSTVSLGFGTKGLNAGGAEDIGPIMKNLTMDTVYVKYVVNVTDLCGQSRSFEYSRTLTCKEIFNPAPFFYGISYSTACKQTQQYGTNRISKSRIADAKIALLNFRNLSKEKSGVGALGKSYRISIEEEYEGVNVKFITGQTASGSRPLVIQARNTNQVKTAVVVVLSSAYGKSIVKVIGPNESITMPMKPGDQKLEVQVTYMDVEQKEPTIDIIQSLKTFVGNQVTIKDGNAKKTRKQTALPCLCIRG